MLRMLLVIIILRSGFQLVRKLIEDGRDNRIDGFLIGCITVPHRDQVGIEPNRKSDTADIITCKDL